MIKILKSDLFEETLQKKKSNSTKKRFVILTNALWKPKNTTTISRPPQGKCDVYFAGELVVESPNVGCFLRLYTYLLYGTSLDYD